MFKVNQVLRDLEIDDISSQNSYGNYSSPIQELINLEKLKDNETSIDISSTCGVNNISYQKKIVEFNEIKNGRLNKEFPELSFFDIKIKHVRTGGRLTYSRLSYSVIGSRKDVKSFMMTERKFSDREFEIKYPKMEILAIQHRKDTFFCSCELDNLGIFEASIKTLRNNYPSINIEVEELKTKFIPKKILNKLNLTKKYKITLEGLNCGVKFIKNYLLDFAEIIEVKK